MKTSGGSRKTGIRNVKVYNIFGSILINFRLYKYIRPNESIRYNCHKNADIILM